MNEYIFITAFMLVIFALLSYLKTKYLKGNKWKPIVLDISAFLLILNMFVFGQVGNNSLDFSNFKLVLIVVTAVYFLYKIYKDIIQLKANTQ